MTKSHESGENHVTKDAKRQAKLTGQDVCALLGQWLAEAKTAGDADRIRDIVKAQKYLGCRNKQKRDR